LVTATVNRLIILTDLLPLVTVLPIWFGSEFSSANTLLCLRVRIPTVFLSCDPSCFPFSWLVLIQLSQRAMTVRVGLIGVAALFLVGMVLPTCAVTTSVSTLWSSRFEGWSNSLTWTGIFASPPSIGSIGFLREGNVIQMTLQVATGITNAAGFMASSSTIPVEWRPAATQLFLVPGYANTGPTRSMVTLEVRGDGFLRVHYGPGEPFPYSASPSTWAGIGDLNALVTVTYQGNSL